MRKLNIPVPVPSKEDFKRGGQTTRTKWQAGRNRLGEAIKVKPASETIKPEIVEDEPNRLNTNDLSTALELFLANN